MNPVVDILMYHSIGHETGPTTITPDEFAQQIGQLAASKLPVLRMDEVPDHLATGQGRAVAITFDDGFQDFAETAWPILRTHGMRPMVYLPTDCMGGHENWAGAIQPPRPLMTWDTVRELAQEGVDFGNHSSCHADLSQLDADALARDINSAHARFARELGQPPAHFAPPYGRSNPAVRRVVAERHKTSVGTVLATAARDSDCHDLPRIEMHYYRSTERWARHLAGKGGLFIAIRRKMRTVRSILTSSAPRMP
jgi:peptidoglycan/xylan/chitin deacetylase (PgdA/CDA1 family)